MFRCNMLKVKKKTCDAIVKGLQAKQHAKQYFNICLYGGALGLLFSPTYVNATGGDYKGSIKSVMDSMIGILGTIFTAVGVLLSAYAVGQLVLAFKNEDADSKTKASTLLVVGIVLIFLKAIINGLNLTSYITS